MYCLPDETGAEKLVNELIAPTGAKPGDIFNMPKCIICQKVYEQGREMTCSEACHEELVRRLIAEFGEFKKVVRSSTGIAYKVPMRDIIEPGVKEEELDRYPIWGEQCQEGAQR